jgi:hypothetical protein
VPAGGKKARTSLGPGPQYSPYRSIVFTGRCGWSMSLTTAAKFALGADALGKELAKVAVLSPSAGAAVSACGSPALKAPWSELKIAASPTNRHLKLWHAMLRLRRVNTSQVLNS